jgi:hypothetical protein
VGATLNTHAAAQNAVTFWNSIAAQTAVRGKAMPGTTGIFLAYADLAAFDTLNAIQLRFKKAIRTEILIPSAIQTGCH